MINPTYMGILRSGEAQSDVLEHLQIISPDVFEQAQNFINQRKETSMIRQTTQTDKNPFLSGMLYCGHCGGRLVASSSGKIIHNKDGTIRRKKRETYVCYNKSRKRLLCTGQTSYTRHYIEDIVEHEILSLLWKLKGSPVDVLKNEFENQVIGRLVRQRTDFEKLIRKSASDISKLKVEYMKALSNKSNFEKQHIMDMILSTERDAKPLEDALAEVQKSLVEYENNTQKDLEAFEGIENWADAYMLCGINQKRMVADLLIDKITVHKDYRIELSINNIF